MSDVIRVHHAGKMGDLVYALPVLRALHRIHGKKVHLTTSGLCWQLVPLLWEQPYIADVVLDESRPYQIPFQTGVTTHWDHYRADEGYNFSLQPKHYDLNCPINWTMSYAWLAGLDLLDPTDLIGLPTLVNHRNWHHQVQVAYDEHQVTMPLTVVVAPEVESLDPADTLTWVQIIAALLGDGYSVILVGRQSKPDYSVQLLAWTGDQSEQLHDLRGLTTVSSLARLIAEASAFIGAHSFPWHLARQAGTPAVCLQGWREGLRRCVPIDTPPERAPWVEPDNWRGAVQWIKAQMGAMV